MSIRDELGELKGDFEDLATERDELATSLGIADLQLKASLEREQFLKDNVVALGVHLNEALTENDNIIRALRGILSIPVYAYGDNEAACTMANIAHAALNGTRWGAKDETAILR